MWEGVKVGRGGLVEIYGDFTFQVYNTTLATRVSNATAYGEVAVHSRAGRTSRADSRPRELNGERDSADRERERQTRRALFPVGSPVRSFARSFADGISCENESGA